MNWTKTVIAVVACLSVGYLSSFITRSAITNWYSTLEKPFFNPPNWLFAPVWSSLYILMGIALGIVWSKYQKNNAEVKNALQVFVFQLLLNALWSLLFFGLKNPLLAFIEIILLWLVIYEAIKSFRKIDGLASKLLIPYLAWVSFATILNGSIWYLNR
ncbi:tryptophan-rich sensory protein [Flavobacterium sp. HXWNR70]|uniref:Tryptophan-rich sensory protein n=1 Tax=Flavobacterium luminosum TaxID=2949086 RepID=A0ABT0TP89_9FLAO|nr:TspO/MBR family protein [Flavobacterium sp. HXWNR70]MCL9809307.1 tryptophan-rich sensory protein [Flavobacterium sp. HXWNR70]